MHEAELPIAEEGEELACTFAQQKRLSNAAKKPASDKYFKGVGSYGDTLLKRCLFGDLTKWGMIAYPNKDLLNPGASGWGLRSLQAMCNCRANLLCKKMSFISLRRLLLCLDANAQ